MSEIQIDDRELSKYVMQLAFVPSKVAHSTSRWVKKLTDFTHGKMRLYARSRSTRSSGALVSGITSKYNLSSTNLGSIIEVDSSVRYQFAAEYGIKRRTVIRGKPIMAFDQSSWKKAGGGLVKTPHRGFYVFSTVLRGKYKGKAFTARAFTKLNEYYQKNEQAILTQLGNSILFLKG